MIKKIRCFYNEAIRTEAKIVIVPTQIILWVLLMTQNTYCNFYRAPSECLLCLDEAYSDFLDDNMIPQISIDQPNIIRMRTFSKAYGLAGLRCGYALACKSLIKSFDKIRNHFGVNRLAQSAALASLRDKENIPKIKKKVRESLGKLSEIAIKNDCIPIDSSANFVSIDCRRDESFAKKIVLTS